METLLFVLLLPMIAPWVAKMIFPHKVGWMEAGISTLIGILLSGFVYAIGSFAQTADVEIWNGEITSKAPVKVSCDHDYKCRCRTRNIPRTCSGSGSKRTCTGGGTETVCDTCYEHSYDVDWRVQSNVGDWTIHRVDRQGTTPPPRWTTINIGDPASSSHHFTNYVKAVPESLFHDRLTNTFEGKIPDYPSGISDYYVSNHAITAIGANIPDLASWNADLRQILRKLGPQKQANVVMVFANTPDQSYLHALEGKWVGGKKNDVIVVIGVTEYPKIDWVAVSSWTENQLFKVQLRDDIMDIGTLDRPQVIKAIERNVLSSFKRKQMADFEYLKYQIEPPFWVLTLAIILGIVSSLGTSYMFYRQSNQLYRRF